MTGSVNTGCCLCLKSMNCATFISLKKNVCGGFAGGGFGGASMFEDLFGGFFGFPGMGGGGGGGRNRRRRGEDTFHPLRFVFLNNFQCTCYPPLSFFLYWKSENYWRQECVCVCATVFQHTSLYTIDLYCQFTCRELLTGTEIAGHGARSNCTQSYTVTTRVINKMGSSVSHVSV